MKKFISLLALLICFSAQAMRESPGGVQDPYARTNYRAGFDQTATWEKFTDVLEYEGTSHVLKGEDTEFQEYLEDQPESKTGFFKMIRDCCFSWLRPASYSSIPQQEPPVTPEATLKKRQIKLNKTLIKLFLRKKTSDARQVIYDELWSTLSFAGVTTAFMGGAFLVLPPAVLATGAGFSAFVLANQLSYTVYAAIKKHNEISNYPTDPLLRHEMRYAILKRFITPALWNGIEEKFFLARTNPFGQEEALKYFETAFNLPKDMLDFRKSEENLEAKIKDTVQDLLADYDLEKAEETKGEGDEDEHTLADQLETSLHHHMLDPKSRNLYLIGEPGLGKTRLVSEIGKRLGIPVLHVKLSDVQSPEDLVGNAQKPGLLLEALTSSPYKNAILFFDEAGEIFNNPAMTPKIKILMEPQEGRFEASFVKGAEISLKNYMIIAASNHEIKDEALRSRFVTVRFPGFQKEFLDEFAKAYVKQIVSQYGCIGQSSSFEDEHWPVIQRVVDRSKTTRDLTNRLPAVVKKLANKVCVPH